MNKYEPLELLAEEINKKHYYTADDFARYMCSFSISYKEAYFFYYGFYCEKLISKEPDETIRN